MAQKFNQYKRAKKSGLTNVDLLKMKETARKEAQKMENKVREQAFLDMLAIPLLVLAHDYWPKSAKKKAPQFIEDVYNLFDSVQKGVTTNEELAAELYELSGVKVEWMERREK